MRAWALITGGGSGIGRAMAVRLCAEDGLGIICVGRREQKLLETKQLCAHPDRVVVVVADVATEEGRKTVVDAAKATCKGDGLKYLVQNAGVVGPLKPSLDLELDEFRAVMATNVEAPVFLSRDLFALLDTARGRILHVSSGCAHKPSKSWLTYCASKAAFLMVYQCLSLEWQGRVAVGSFKPGIVATEMQDEMRQASPEAFPKVDFFKKLKTSHDEFYSAGKEKPDVPHVPDPSRLDSAENVAHFAWYLLSKTTNEEFASKDWDIREEKEWLKHV